MNTSQILEPLFFIQLALIEDMIDLRDKGLSEEEVIGYLQHYAQEFFGAYFKANTVRAELGEKLN